MTMKFILGRKEGMTQLFDEDGAVVPVTVVTAGPCYVAQTKTRDNDGYSAVQLAFVEKKLQRASKPLKGHFKKAGLFDEGSGDDKKKGSLRAFQYLREFRIQDSSEEEYKPGDKVDVEKFQRGDLLDVIGISKGRGFAGVMKRWNFAGGPQTHGGMCNRRPGAIGMHSDPSRVFKGKKMAGHFGNARITVKNLEVIDVNVERNMLLIKGSVPGPRNGLLCIRTAKTGTPKKVDAKVEASGE